MRSAGWRVLLLVASFTLLPAQPSFAQADRSDPWEGMNRKFFGLEETLDRHLVGPLARGFAKTPSPIRAAWRNVTSNLKEPLVFVNDMLQGHVGTAASTLGRFAINSTFGILGVMDVAKRGGIPHHPNSFGTTLARWGVGSGPYLFLPLLGPSTVRDLFGSGVDIGLDPFTYVHYSGQTEVGITTTLIGGVNERIDAQRDLDTVRETSTDPYATIRSYFLQNRQYEITGRPVELETLPDFDLPTATPPAEPQAPTSPAESASSPPSDTEAPPPPAEPDGAASAPATASQEP